MHRNIRRLFLRLRSLISPRRPDGEVDEELAFHVDMQTRRNLEAGMAHDEARRRARKLLDENGLADAANRQIRALSKGMSQKVQLLSAIAHEPELVILDEPFSGLDPVNQQSLESLIRDLARRGATVELTGSRPRGPRPFGITLFILSFTGSELG